MRSLEQLVSEAMLIGGGEELAHWHTALTDEERAAFEAFAEETTERVTKTLGQFATALEPAMAVLTACAEAHRELFQQTKETPSCEC